MYLPCRNLLLGFHIHVDRQTGVLSHVATQASIRVSAACDTLMRRCCLRCAQGQEGVCDGGDGDGQPHLELYRSPSGGLGGCSAWHDTEALPWPSPPSWVRRSAAANEQCAGTGGGGGGWDGAGAGQENVFSSGTVEGSGTGVQDSSSSSGMDSGSVGVGVGAGCGAGAQQHKWKSRSVRQDRRAQEGLGGGAAGAGGVGVCGSVAGALLPQAATMPRRTVNVNTYRQRLFGPSWAAAI